jgi:diphosphomevalonate decarboxylase
MTLDKCHTFTDVTFKKNNSNDFIIKSFLLDNIQNDKFSIRIENFIQNNKEHFLFLNGYDASIITTNSFPHSSGIASSASGMAALIMCLMELEATILNCDIDYKKASNLARLASGSASRSIFGGITTWGKSSIPFSNDEYAVNVNEIESFPALLDSIIIVSNKVKDISSSAGHSLMNAHPFAESRFKQAGDNLADMISAMKTGDIKIFGEILELEALTLHSLMLSSSPSFILLEPKSLEVIALVKEFRQKTNVPLYFTIDAGPNIHLIYPESEQVVVTEFINKNLSSISSNIIHDRLGDGPVLIEKSFE